MDRLILCVYEEEYAHKVTTCTVYKNCNATVHWVHWVFMHKVALHLFTSLYPTNHITVLFAKKSAQTQSFESNFKRINVRIEQYCMVTL